MLVRLSAGVSLQERQASHAKAGPARSVPVKRPEHIQEARAGLPVLGMEQEIMEAITGNDVCLLCGETGSGKTTQARLKAVSMLTGLLLVVSRLVQMELGNDCCDEEMSQGVPGEPACPSQVAHRGKANW